MSNLAELRPFVLQTDDKMKSIYNCNVSVVELKPKGLLLFEPLIVTLDCERITREDILHYVAPLNFPIYQVASWELEAQKDSDAHIDVERIHKALREGNYLATIKPDGLVEIILI